MLLNGNLSDSPNNFCEEKYFVKESNNNLTTLEFELVCVNDFMMSD